MEIPLLVLGFFEDESSASVAQRELEGRFGAAGPGRGGVVIRKSARTLIGADSEEFLSLSTGDKIALCHRIDAGGAALLVAVAGLPDVGHIARVVRDCGGEAQVGAGVPVVRGVGSVSAG